MVALMFAGTIATTPACLAPMHTQRHQLTVNHQAVPTEESAGRLYEVISPRNEFRVSLLSLQLA
jgi:hypothetical protein